MIQIPGVLVDLVRDPTLRTVSAGAAALGLVSGGLGSFAVLRRQSLLGDAISHVALPGIALAFLLTGSRAPLVLLLGAAAAGWIGTLLVMGIARSTRVKEDSALGIVLSVFFGLGLVLLTFIQKRPDAAQAGLDRFLFGQAATLLAEDVAIIAGLGVVAIGTTLLLWKEFKLLSFDREFGASLGIPMRGIDVVLTSVIVIAVVIGLQTVGVVLMAAMVVAPGAAARQWTDRLGTMVVLGGIFGALSGVAGAVLSATTPRLPTGPTIVLCLTAVALVSITFAPRRGWLWAAVRRARGRRRLATEAVLLDLRALAAQHADRAHGHPARLLEALGVGSARRSLRALEERGLVRETGPGHWALTPEGWNVATALAASRGVDGRAAAGGEVRP